VKAELAGVDIDEVSLEIRGRQLIIQGERRAQEASGRLYQQIEIAHGPFRRVVELGADVEAERATATYEDGILRIEIPLVEQADETRRIPIEGKELGEGR
jgi:HSP20 family protein